LIRETLTGKIKGDFVEKEEKRKWLASKQALLFKHPYKQTHYRRVLAANIKKREKMRM